MSERTPAPWFIRRCKSRHQEGVDTIYISGKEDDGIATVCEMNQMWVHDARVEANALLISAAPDMAEALEDVLEVLYDGDPRRQEDCTLCDKIRTALSKAGRTIP